MTNNDSASFEGYEGMNEDDTVMIRKVRYGGCGVCVGQSVLYQNVSRLALMWNLIMRSSVVSSYSFFMFSCPRCWMYTGRPCAQTMSDENVWLPSAMHDPLVTQRSEQQL